MPCRCFVRGMCKHAGCTCRPPPLLWQGQAERRDSHQPRAVIQPEGTCDGFPLQPQREAQAQGSFSPGYTAALPVTTTGGSQGAERSTAPLACTPRRSFAVPPTRCLVRGQGKKAGGCPSVPRSAQRVHCSNP